MKNIAAKILGVIAFTSLFFGCKKNDGKGTFYLNLKSVNGSTFSSGERIVFSFEFNHPTSDIVKDSLFIRTKFFTCSNSNLLAKEAVPEYTSTANDIGQYELAFQIGSGNYRNPCIIANTNNYRKDSLIYTFWLKDKDGNLSDSVSSDKIILKP